MGDLPSVPDLDAAVRDGLVSRKLSGCGRLAIYNYRPRCQFENIWTPVTRAARGLVLEVATGRCVARPWPKFFNAGTAMATPPAGLPDEVTEKVDGSLGIGFRYGGEMWWCTRGAFDSPQAAVARRMWAARHAGMDDPISEGVTLLVEILAPESRVVVQYERDALVLLGVRTTDGDDLAFPAVQAVAARLGMDCARTYEPGTPEAIKALADAHDDQFEGYVLRWGTGAESYRVKVKGADYLRTHRVLQGLTTRRICDFWYAGEDLPSVASEEIRAHAGRVCAEMGDRVAMLHREVADCWAGLNHLTDRGEFARAAQQHPRLFSALIRRFTGSSPDLPLQVYRERFNGARPRSVGVADA